MNIEEFLRTMRDIRNDFVNEIEELGEKYQTRLTKTLHDFVGEVELTDNKIPMERSR